MLLLKRNHQNGQAVLSGTSMDRLTIKLQSEKRITSIQNGNICMRTLTKHSPGEFEKYIVLVIM